MPICVLTTHGSLPLTEDNEILEILADVNKVANGVYYVAEYTHKTKQWFRKPVMTKLYELYFDYDGYGLQLINHGGGSCSINTMVSKATVMAYLYGFWNGYKEKSKEQ